MTQKEEYANIKKEIEQHVIFSFPKKERLNHKKEFSNLVELVMKLKGFDRKIQSRLSMTNENALCIDEQERKIAQTKGLPKYGLTSQMDTVAFMESINKAVKNFDPNKDNIFMTYFERIYSNEVNNQNNDTMSNSTGLYLNKGQRKLYKQLCKLCEQLNVDVLELPQRYYDTIAKQLNISRENLETIISLAGYTRTAISLNDTSDSDGEGNKTALDVEDPNCGNEQYALDIKTWLIDCITAFADLDTAEYPKLFFTNDMLNPLTDKNTDAALEYCGDIEPYENYLWKTIFNQGYIDFVFSAPPTLDCARNLMKAKQNYPLKDTSISKYKNVSRAYISISRKKYSKLLDDIIAKTNK